MQNFTNSKINIKYVSKRKGDVASLVCNSNQIKKVFSNKIFGILNLPLGGENRSSRIYDLKTNAYVR